MNTYYLVWEVTTALSAAQKTKLWTALHRFGRQIDDQPFRITHGRARVDGQAALMVLTVSGDVTKADLLQALADEIGISPATLNANSTFTKMSGASTDERAASARDYIAANAVAWGEL